MVSIQVLVCTSLCYSNFIIKFPIIKHEHNKLPTQYVTLLFNRCLAFKAFTGTFQ